LRERFEGLMTNILKVILQRNEEKIGCVITAYYELEIDEEMIFKAITNEHFQWLKFLWAFKKNCVGPRIDRCFIDYTKLFRDMILYEYEDMIPYVCQWKINTDDSIIHALLDHNLDKIAIEHMGAYTHLLDKNLFLFCIDHGNDIFLKAALILSAFDK
jgi:hypothetical protein